MAGMFGGGGDLSAMSKEEQAAYAMLQKKQMTDFIMLFNGLTRRCFDACATDFSTRKLTKPEDECTNKCVSKYLKAAERIGKRFAEEQQLQQEAQGGA